MEKPVIAIFSGRLLPASETFVKAQAEGLTQFTPYFAGARLVQGLSLPAERTLVVNQGKPWGNVQEYVFKQTGFAPAFYRRLKHINPQLIHAHFGVCGTLALPLASTLRCPLVVTYHGFDACMTDDYAQRNSISTRVYLRRRESLKKNAQLFIAVSQFIKERLIQQGFPQDRIHVHYIGVDTHRFQPDVTLAREPVVLFVGRLTEKKGGEYLIRAMEQVQAARPDARLVVIGDGDQADNLKALAHSLLHHYEFLGVQPSDVVRRWMNQASVLVAPSVTTATGDSEGLPTVIIEAQAMGLPVVSSIHAGIPEAVIHETTGFLTAERDWRSLSGYILQLLEDPALWQRFSTQGRSRVLEQFNLTRQTEILETIYQSVLASA